MLRACAYLAVRYKQDGAGRGWRWCGPWSRWSSSPLCSAGSPSSERARPVCGHGVCGGAALAFFSTGASDASNSAIANTGWSAATNFGDYTPSATITGGLHRFLHRPLLPSARGTDGVRRPRGGSADGCFRFAGFPLALFFASAWATAVNVKYRDFFRHVIPFRRSSGSRFAGPIQFEHSAAKVAAAPYSLNPRVSSTHCWSVWAAASSGAELGSASWRGVFALAWDSGTITERRKNLSPAPDLGFRSFLTARAKAAVNFATLTARLKAAPFQDLRVLSSSSSVGSGLDRDPEFFSGLLDPARLIFQHVQRSRHLCS